MAGDLVVGDVVRLRSGGPRMTVNKVGLGMASCSWFKGTDLNRGDFAVLSLVKVEAEDSGPVLVSTPDDLDR